MRLLKLHFEKLIQGDFILKPLNLLLVFQVNCPGCFFYAFPVFNELYANLDCANISFLGLSTAFEDFDKNTFENTRKLVEKGELVGETEKAMASQNAQKLPYSINFPIAMDEKVTAIEDIENAVNHICSLNPNYKIWPNFDQKELQKKVSVYLNYLEYTSLTFTLNQLKGTPSLIFFNSDYEILNDWFGVVKYEDIVKSITAYTQLYNK